MWTVHCKLGGTGVLTRQVEHLGAQFLLPRAHRSVRWFTYAVFVPESVDMLTHTVIARFSHYTKHHLDRPRDPRRIPD